MTSMASTTDKRKCIQRELRMRRAVYHSRIERGSMTQEEADREIKLMEEILADYRAKESDELGQKELKL